jgi:hypothetical protein
VGVATLLLVDMQADIQTDSLESVIICGGCAKSFDLDVNLHRHCRGKPVNSYCRLWFDQKYLNPLYLHDNPSQSIHSRLTEMTYEGEFLRFQKYSLFIVTKPSMKRTWMRQ